MRSLSNIKGQFHYIPVNGKMLLTLLLQAAEESQKIQSGFRSFSHSTKFMALNYVRCQSVKHSCRETGILQSSGETLMFLPPILGLCFLEQLAGNPCSWEADPLRRPEAPL